MKKLSCMLNYRGGILTNEDGIVGNILKVGLLLVLGIALLVYMVALFTGAIGKKEVKEIKRSTDPKEIAAAEETIKNIITLNSFGCVKESKEKNGYLIITVIDALWKKLPLSDKKLMLEKLAAARSKLGIKPQIKVIDHNALELASYENNRINLAEYDF